MGFATVLRYFGFGVTALAVLMTIPYIFALSGSLPGAGDYLFGVVFTLICGGAILVTAGRARPATDFRGALALLVLWWTVAPLLAAVPLMLRGFSFVDAYFEAVSALTTTGALLSPELAYDDHVSMLWRALLQWAGGLVSIAVAASIIVRPAFFGIDTLQPPFSRGEHDSYLRAFRNAVRAFLPLYAALTVLAVFCLNLTGLDPFGSMIFALSLISSGGYLPTAGPSSALPLAALAVAVPFFLVSALNFIVLSLIVRGTYREIRNAESRVFLIMVFAVAFLFWLVAGAGDIDLIIVQIFNSASLLATNGITIGEAPPFAVAAIAALVGGTSVSTAGGLKVLRWQIIMRRGQEEIRRLVSPNVVSGTNRVSDELGIWIHFLVFTVILAVVVISLTVFGHNFELAAAAAVAALTNTGPILAYGDGGAAAYGIFETQSRLILIAVMILGRIEVVAALALLNRAFWRA